MIVPARTRASPSGPWVRSIRGRLIVAYTASALATLVLATGFLYWALVSSLNREDEEFLADKIRVLQWIFREHPGNSTSLHEEVTQEPRSVSSSAPEARNYYVRVLDGQRNVLVDTPGMDHMVPASEFPVPPVDRTANVVTSRDLPDGRSYLLIAAQAEHRAGGPQRFLQIALDRSREEHLVAAYRRRLAVALVCGTVLSVVAAIGVARMSLRPIAAMAKAVEGIGATRLHERIGPQRWPEELRALTAAFDVMLARLEDSFARLSSFSAELAHQLRTPINVLRGEAEVALSRPRTPEEYRAVLESSLEEYGRLSRVIERLLFLARADRSAVPIDRSRFEARPVIDDIVEFHRPLAEERDVRVMCRGNVCLDADSLLFRQAFANVLDNALRFTPSRGTITVGLEGSAAGPAIAVTDTGPGIEPEHLPRICDPFYRGDHGEPGGHAGLGLAVVKSVMDLHGGRVTVESKRGRGTTVTLQFLAADGPEKMTRL